MFTIPDATLTIASSTEVVTAWVPEFLPVIYLALGMVVVVGTILFVSRKLSGGARAILGGKRRGGRRRRR